MEDLKPVYKAVNEDMGYEDQLSFEKNGVRNTHLPPNPGSITGPIFPLSLNTSNSIKLSERTHEYLRINSKV